MSPKSLWNFFIKIASLLAIVLLFVGAGLTYAAGYDLTDNKMASVLFAAFAAALGIFALVVVSFDNYQLENQLKDATNIANLLAVGELVEEEFAEIETSSELLHSLEEISIYLREKAEAADLIATGDLSIETNARAETDVLSRSFQNMIEKLRLLVQTKEERDLLQKSIIKLSSEVSEVAAGDLTVQAEVSPEMTGAIAEAFNSMTKELRSLIKQVKDVTFQVSSSANAINDTTEQLARGSEAQASQISLTTSAISQMLSQIQEVSGNASLSAQVAGDALVNARYGTQAVQDNIGAMNSIRKQVQETAKRIKKLGERSQEISQIVNLIDDLSDRTSLLALNASLQASAAGEAGEGFALVAEEVERLAERSNRLTNQIGTLTQTIQTETKDVVASMEETIHEVVVGSALADRAGQALIEIEQVSTRLAELIESISESAKRQADSSEDISQAMSNISKVTELVQNGTKRAANSVKMLVELSDDLRGSVAPFKLPEDKFSNRRPPTADGNLYVN